MNGLGFRIEGLGLEFRFAGLRNSEFLSPLLLKSPPPTHLPRVLYVHYFKNMQLSREDVSLEEGDKRPITLKSLLKIRGSVSPAKSNL